MSGQYVSPRHGRVITPESRAVFAREKGLLLDDSVPNSLEAGKFFPLYAGNQYDALAPSDNPSGTPPADGKIASAGYPAGAILDEPRSDWQKHEVRSGDKFTVSWAYQAIHTTRRWNYFLTHQDWNPSEPLKRAHFEATPFYKVEFAEQPYWAHGDALTPRDPTVHELMLPRREGYQVLLAIWEVANTGAAFYQVIDLQFAGVSEGQAPTIPHGFSAVSKSSAAIELDWLPSTASAGSHIDYYSVHRDGIDYLKIYDLAVLPYRDTGLSADTEYTYFVSATDNLGRRSLPSEVVSVRTWEAGGEVPPPTAPGNLHSMATTHSSITIMWTGSVSARGILYIVYRDGGEIARLPQRTLEFVDEGLAAGTTYLYAVKAFDTSGQFSPASNTLSVTTQGAPGVPEWSPAAVRYGVADRVSYQGRLYSCFQAHISNSGWSPVAAVTLWTRL